jgi:hypothetical protein
MPKVFANLKYSYIWLIKQLIVKNMRHNKTRYTLFALAFFLLLSKVIIAQLPSWVWARSAGSNQNELGESIAIDQNGNIFLAGNFNYMNINIDNTTIINHGGSDMFLVKYDSLANVIWAKSFGNSGTDYINDITLDLNGNIYMTGSFNYTINFGSISLNSATGKYFIVKFDTNGNALWAKNSGGFMPVTSNSIDTDNLGNVYVTGDFSSYTVTFDTITITSAYNGEMFIVKYDTNGNVLWAKSAGGFSTDIGEAIDVDQFGNVFVTGRSTSATMLFDTILLNNYGYSDVFIAKYNTNGDILWAKNGNGNENDYAYGLATDTSGNAYITGSFYSIPFSFDSVFISSYDSTYDSDIFVVKFNPNGDVLWAKSAGGISSDRGIAVATDKAENVYVTGYAHYGNAYFDTIVQYAQGNENLFVAKYNSGGNILWVKYADYNSSVDNCKAYEIAIDKVGDVYLAGSFSEDSMRFGSSTIINNGNMDMFMAKLTNNTTTGIEKLTKQEGFLYPNPFSESTTFQTEEPLNNATLHISNILGNKVSEINNINGNKFVISRDQLPAGLYFIQLSQNNKLIMSKKVVISSSDN